MHLGEGEGWDPNLGEQVFVRVTIVPQLQLADILQPQSTTLGFHPVARKLLLISRPTEGRRLSWPEHTVG